MLICFWVFIGFSPIHCCRHHFPQIKKSGDELGRNGGLGSDSVSKSVKHLFSKATENPTLGTDLVDKKQSLCPSSVQQF